MSAQTIDPFDLDEVPREKGTKRPLLIPAAGGDRVPYTRTSTLSDFVTSDFGLTTWTKRLLAVGLAQREDVCGLLAALPPLNDAKCDKTTLSRAQREQDAATKRKIDEYIEMALETAGRNYKANHGTAIHGFIEHGRVEQAPERMRPDAQSALDTLDKLGIDVLARETFVANDELMAAGSFDALLRVPTLGVVMADVKTGQVDKKGLQFGVQLSAYVNGQAYDWHDDTRQPLEAFAQGERVNRRIGVVIHVPLGAGRTDLYMVDLVRGYQAAKLATQVRQFRSYNDLMKEATF